MSHEHTSFLFGFSSITIASALFLIIIFCNELCYRIGVLVQARTDDEVKALTASVQVSILGLLALLIGFTFSMSMQRFDNRSMALIDEANAIGTAILRADLLPAEQQAAIKPVMQKYLQARIEMSGVDLTLAEDRQAYSLRIAAIQAELWSLAIAASEADARPATTGAFLNSLNELIDRQSKRSALLKAHVPEPILLLLLFVIVASISMMGYSSGLSNKRVFVPLALISFLITLIVFIIIDLDRPKRGLITVDQSALVELLQKDTD
ncbi:bestrophin-like domain [Planctobacterium marinum]|uniref:bestrophin-like domain n=1 Tax=Planctobacterium marinum TaxID=1631968 RepID=UPI001E48FA7B|nr:hypothetical protein [Planctobacterium marinum]MCC2605398.1 hypothetical protein [Planctobacterium marinum]